MRRALLALAAAVSVLVTVDTVAPAVAHALPPGFNDLTVASVWRPTAVESLPGGRQTVVLEQHSGRVRVIDTATGALHPGFALDLAVCTGSEQGLLGFTEDPGFAANGRVYVYYTTPVGGACRNRVSAFQMLGLTIAPESEQILIEITTVRTNHNGGDLDVGDDGWLYVSVGDGGADPRGDSGSGGTNDAAGDLSILHGKILRIDRMTGLAAPSNPHAGHPQGVDCGKRAVLAAPTSVCREIFAHGLRNPYRFAFDPNGPDSDPNGGTASAFHINDVGQDTQEEIDVGIVGADYGWPLREGNCPQGEVPPCAGPPPASPPLLLYTDPIESYTHAVGTYITGGAFVPNGAWPEEFDGGYLFADGGSGKVWLLDADGNVDYGNPLLSGKFGIADLAFVLEPDGWALYYTRNSAGIVGKVTYAFPDEPPSGPTRFERLPAAERVMDTRTGANPVPMRAGRTRLVSLGRDAVGAEAALVNITLASPAAWNFATVWAPRTRRPATSNLNALAGEDVANASIVPVDSEGRLLLYTEATTDVIVDLVGVFRAAPGEIAAGRFEDVVPARLVDTRSPSGPGNVYTRTAGGGGEVVTVPVAGRAGIPTSGVDSVVFLLSGISADVPRTGWLVAYEGGAPRPPSSNLNVNGHTDTRVNTAVVPLAPDGSIDVYLSEVADVIVEVVGWFSDDSGAPSTAGRFHLVRPTREVDTRPPPPGPFPEGGLGHGEQLTLDLAAKWPGASAVAQNLTFAPAGGWGYVTASPDLPAPTVSNLNATAPGQVRAALALTPLNAGGSETFTAAAPFTAAKHQLLVDVYGYFE